MYICIDCGYKFSTAETISERHNLDSPPYESISVCPACKSENFYKQNLNYCRFCGTHLKNGAVDYCSDKCRTRGKNAWLKETKRKKLRAKSDVYKKVRQIELYNKLNKTKLSYGQFVALIDCGE